MKFILFFAALILIFALGDTQKVADSSHSLNVATTPESTGKVECYSCHLCNDPFDETQKSVSKCMGAICVKIVKGYKNESFSNIGVIQRGCDDKNSRSSAEELNSRYICDTNLCNSTSSLIISTSIFLFSMIFSILILR